jgi:sirohydrochlorin cobaltochelatase
MKARGNKDFHVGTVEGYPTMETVLAQLKANKAKQVTLVPLMFVAGDHARNDIAGDWKESLEAAGLKVDVRMEGLGQLPEVQDLFIEHARFGMRHKMVDIMKKKAIYEKTGEKQDH